MDRDRAIKATRNGAIATLFVGVVTLAFVITALLLDADGYLGRWNDPLAFFDVGILLFLAFGIYRKSRTAAIALFGYFLLSQLIFRASSEGLVFRGIPLALILLYYFAMAIYGSFVFHRLEKRDNPEYRAPRRWPFFIGIPIGLGIAVIMSYGALTMIGVFPSTEVLAGAEVMQKHAQQLREEGVIDADETIEYFYSSGLFSILDHGSVLTDRRVISYFKNEESDLEIYELFFADIRSIEMIEEGDYLNDAIYLVDSWREDAWLPVVLSTEAGGDIQFIDTLRSKMAEHPPPAVPFGRKW